MTWTTTDVTSQLGTNMFAILAVDTADPGTPYLRVIDNGAESVAVSRDSGATFSNRSS